MKWSGPDDVRPLSEKGRQQSERLGLFLAATAMRPSAILSSPKARALETAQLVAEQLGMQVGVIEELGGPLEMETVEELLRAAGNPARPMLVGHDPDFSALAAELSGVPALPIRKATLVRIDLPRPLRAGSGNPALARAAGFDLAGRLTSAGCPR